MIYLWFYFGLSNFGVSQCYIQLPSGLQASTTVIYLHRYADFLVVGIFYVLYCAHFQARCRHFVVLLIAFDTFDLICLNNLSEKKKNLIISSCLINLIQKYPSKVRSLPSLLFDSTATFLLYRKTVTVILLEYIFKINK